MDIFVVIYIITLKEKISRAVEDVVLKKETDINEK